MATNQTTNYQLNQWEPTDAVQRVEFNQDNAKIDAALKSLSDQVVQKANQSALNTLISSVNQKADASTVSSLSSLLNSEISQRQAADSSLQTALTLKGNCQIYYGTYTGRRSADSRTLDLSRAAPFDPNYGGQFTVSFSPGQSEFDVPHKRQCRRGVRVPPGLGTCFTWSGYSEYCANNSGETYYVAALIAADE